MFQHQRVLQRLLNRFPARLQNPETLIVTLLGVLARQIDEGALLPALRNGDLNAMFRVRRKQTGQGGAIGEVHRDVDVLRDIGLVNVELLQQRREESSRLKGSDRLLGRVAR